MESERDVLNKRYNKKEKKVINSRIHYQIKLLYFFIFIFLIAIIILIYYIFKVNYKTKENYLLFLDLKNNISQVESKISNLENKKNIEFNPEKKNIVFDQDTNDELIKEQNNFCINQNANLYPEFEDQIVSTKIELNNITFDLFVYKKKDVVSEEILKKKNWEANETNNLLKALDYYSEKKNLKKEDIYILDIGANIGWYTIFLGKYGYKVIGFEPSGINFYILKKNYCLNREVNITLINKGLFNEEKKCDYYMSVIDIGDGWVICDKKDHLPNDLKKTGEIFLTKLNNYASFLSEHNLAVIKIDVEGSEGKAIEGGNELITKYHVPFIFLEFSPKSLIIHGTDPKEFLQMFENNGYKFSFSNFFGNDYVSIDNIINTIKGFSNIYIIYSKILE